MSQPSVLKKYDEEIEGVKKAKFELGLFSTHVYVQFTCTLYVCTVCTLCVYVYIYIMYRLLLCLFAI